MRYTRLLNPRTWLFAGVATLLVLAVACGSSETAPIVVEKEVIKEVPVEVIVEKEVIKEVEVVKEVIVEKEIVVHEAKPELAEGVPAYVALGKYGGHVPMGSWGLGVRTDVHQASSMTEASHAADQWSNLIQFNPENPNELIGELVKTWELSDDGLTYTFKMQDNAHWWDGVRITAHDVKFSIDRMAEGETSTKRRTRVGRINDYVKSVDVIDDDTFKFNLRFTGAPALLPYLAVEFMKILPKHVLSKIDLGTPERQFEDNEVTGSGGFKLVKWAKGNYQQFEKHDNYWKPGRPFWDGYTNVYIREPQRVIAAFRSDQVLMWSHAWPGLSIKDYIALGKELKDTWDFHFLTPSGGVGFMINPTRKPFSDYRVRKALYLALDRKAIVDGWVFGKGVQGAPFVPGTWMSAPDEEVNAWPGHRYVNAAGEPVVDPYNSDVPVFKDPQDIEEAKRLLTEAGYPDGFEAVTIISSSTEEGAVILSKGLKEAGINLKFEAPEGGVWRQRVNNHLYDLTHRNYSLSIMDPDDILGGTYLVGGSRNLMNWEDPELTALADAQRRVADRSERRKALEELEDYIRGAVPGKMPGSWVQTVYGKFVVMPVSKLVQNYRPCFTLQQCLHHEHLWLTEEGISRFK